MSVARLPIPGGDDGSWGEVLNTYLSVEHNTNGTLKKTALIDGAEQTSSKGQANGYAGLGSDGIVPTAQLPSHFDGVGDYIGVYSGIASVDPATYTNIAWESTTVTHGLSLSWTVDNPNTVIVEATGVYSIHLMSNWLDEADTSGSYRWAQVNAACGFYMQNRVPSVNNVSTPVSTIQNVYLTAYLQTGQNIFAALEQGSVSPITPDVRMLITRVA